MGNTINLKKPYRRRVSTDRLNCEDRQLVASLEGEPGPAPAGKTLPHLYPNTRFWREKTRVNMCVVGPKLFFGPGSRPNIN